MLLTAILEEYLPDMVETLRILSGLKNLKCNIDLKSSSSKPHFQYNARVQTVIVDKSVFFFRERAIAVVRAGFAVGR